jgi:bacterioferritin-associated ferredoxin
MYICICKAVTDGQIRDAIHQGACTRKQLVECLSVGRVCGKCNADVRDLLHQYAPQPNCAPPVSHCTSCNTMVA